MSIIATEVDSIHGGTNQQRIIFYRCQDSQGNWHNYGPVITVDPMFDVDAYKSVVTNKVANTLAEREADELLEQQ